MSRAQTLVLALLVINVLLGSLCVAVSRGERGSPALRLWGQGMVIYALGLVTTILTFAPRPLVLFVGNTLITLAPIYSIRGALAYTRGTLSRAWVWPGFAATVAVLAWGNFVASPIPLVNLTAPTVMAVATFLAGAFQLVREPPRDAITPGRFLALVLLLAVFVWLTRIAFMWGPASTTDREQLDLVISLFVIAQIVIAVASTLAFFWIEVHKMQVTLTRVAYSDALTELPNRRAMLARFREEAARAVRSGTSFSLVVLDIDHFKRVNDEHGHLAGDAALRHVADLLRAGKREEDALGRVGGEEFVILLSGAAGTTLDGVERLRESIAATPLPFDGKAIPITASAGLAQFPDEGGTWDQLFATADRRLYESKRAGRNRVTAAG